MIAKKHSSEPKKAVKNVKKVKTGKMNKSNKVNKIYNSNKSDNVNKIDNNILVDNTAPIEHKDIVSTYKEGLLSINKQEEEYDKLFEQKLAEQYKEFKKLKDQHAHGKRFIRIIAAIIIVILTALLLMTYG